MNKDNIQQLTKTICFCTSHRCQPYGNYLGKVRKEKQIHVHLYDNDKRVTNTWLPADGHTVL